MFDINYKIPTDSERNEEKDLKRQNPKDKAMNRRHYLMYLKRQTSDVSVDSEYKGAELLRYEKTDKSVSENS